MSVQTFAPIDQANFTDNFDQAAGLQGWKFTVGGSDIRLGSVRWISGAGAGVPVACYLRDSSKNILDTAFFDIGGSDDTAYFGTAPNFNDGPIMSANTTYYIDAEADGGDFWAYGFYDLTGLLPLTGTYITWLSTELEGSDMDPSTFPFMLAFYEITIQTETSTLRLLASAGAGK